MHASLRSIIALTCGMVAAQAGLAATASVSVSATGKVAVTPARVVVPPADRSVSFQLATANHVIVSISVIGGPTKYACVVAANGQSASCRKGDDSGKGDLQASLVLQQVGGPTLPGSNFWIQND